VSAAAIDTVRSSSAAAALAATVMMVACHEVTVATVATQTQSVVSE
jgi:hypothetical protein